MSSNSQQRLLVKSGVSGGQSLKVTYTYNPLPGITPCIYDVVCLESAAAETVAAVGKVENVDPSGTDFQYDAAVRYQCPEGREFDVNGDGNITYSTIDYECQWNDTWTRDPNAPPACICMY